VVESAEAAAEALAAAEPDTLLLDLTHPALDLVALAGALAPGNPVPPESLDAVERRHIHLVLRHTGGNRRQAARLLGISRSTLHNKLRRYAIEPE
jgi:DNA-binding NtrC family response regulator